MNQQVKLVGTLSMVAGILSILLAIPVLSGFINPFSILTIALFVLSVIILIKSKGTVITKTAPVLAIISSILGIIATIIVTVALGATASMASNAASDAEAAGNAIGGILAGGFFASLFSFPGWILLILAAIFFLINASKASKAAAAEQPAPVVDQTVVEIIEVTEVTEEKE